MSQTRSTRSNQIATPDAVKAVCDELFRAGEKITEATVRARLGGGSTTTILKLIRAWDEHLRTEFLALESKVAQYEGGDAPPDVPEALWAALKPVWGRVLAEARSHAESRLASDRAALAEARQGLEADAERVRELDARWQQEKQEWAARIDGLNGEFAKARERITALAQDLIEAGREATAHATTIEGLREQLARTESALADAQAAHQADLDRWAQQVDEARQEAKEARAAASGGIRMLEEQLASVQAALSDLRIEHERIKVLASAAHAADARSQAEIGRLRQEQAIAGEQRRDEAAENARIVASLQADLAAAKSEAARLADAVKSSSSRSRKAGKR